MFASPSAAGSRLRHPPSSATVALAAKRSSVPEAVKPDPKESPLIQTGSAPFLTAGDQPLLLSPNGLRTARFEFDTSGLLLRVEAAPTFGLPGAGGSAVASQRDIIDRVRIIPKEELGLKGVRDLFWLDDRRFLITGFEGQTGQVYGWVTDHRQDKATVVSMPYRDASLFVPLGLDNTPSLRYDERGEPDVLLGFSTKSYDGNVTRSWAWFNVASGDLVDAAVSEELPTELWREVDVSQTGFIEAILLVNGSVHRRSPEGWAHVGDVGLCAAEGEAAMQNFGSLLRRKFLISAGPDYSAYVLDRLDATSKRPAVIPSTEHLTLAFTEDMPSVDSIDANAWVLQQCQERQTAALVHLAGLGAKPAPIFAHPFADVMAEGVWLHPETGVPEAVTVDDLRPRCYSFKEEHGKLLASLQAQLPPTVMVGNAQVSSQSLEPMIVERHQSRWLVQYFHPSIRESVVLPAVVEDGQATWIGKAALPARGGALNAGAIPLKPRVEGHRIWVGAHDVPVYLLLPEKMDPAALVVRVHEGINMRDTWGADGQDGWLLSRGYGVLRVNYRGSAGFGGLWSSLAPSSEAGDGSGFLDDIVAAVRWALDDRQVLGAEPGSKPPVAIMGSYFGGYAALHAMLREQDLFACGIAVAPLQELPHWPDNFVPDSATKERVEAAREEDLSLDPSADPARSVLAPAAFANALRGSNLLIFEYENDSPEYRGRLLSSFSPSGSAPSSWPKGVRLLQYAGENHGGGTFRQNSLDQHRRIDNFLYQHLNPRRAKGAPELLRETFVDELPFLAGALLPQTKGVLSDTAKELEVAFRDGLKSKDALQASQLPEPTVAGKKPELAGFGGKASKKNTRRSPVVSPQSRVSVRADGATEIAINLPEAPTGFHALLSELWFHVRAEGLGYTVALPRKVVRPAEIKAHRLSGGNGYIFEIPGEAQVGAVQSYQEWSRMGAQATVLTWATPSEIMNSPLLVPADHSSGEDGKTVAAAVEVVAEASSGPAPASKPSPDVSKPTTIEVVDV